MRIKRSKRSSDTREKSAYVQRIPHSEVEDIELLDPPITKRWNLAGYRQINLRIRTRGEVVGLNLMKKV